MNSFNKKTARELENNISNITMLLKAMAHYKRIMILYLLLSGEKPVAYLCKNTKASQCVLSQHMSILKRERLVVSRRNSGKVFFALSEAGHVIVGKMVDTGLMSGCQSGAPSG